MKIFVELREWVRGRLFEVAVPQETDETALSELAEIFPDTDVVEALPGENDDRDIEGEQIVLAHPRPVRRKPRDTSFSEEEDDDDTESPSGPGKKRATRRKAGTSHGAWEILDPRVVSDPNDPTRKTVHFTPMVSGPAKMEISIAGDSVPEWMKTVDVGELEARIRKSVAVSFGRPVSDALLVSVFPARGAQ